MAPNALTETTSRPVTQRRMSKSWMLQSRKRPPEVGCTPPAAGPVPGHGAHRVQPAELTVAQRLPGRAVAEVEPALEADLHGYPAALGVVDDLAGAGHVEGHRLLAEHRHPGVERLVHQRGVGARGRGDHHARPRPRCKRVHVGHGLEAGSLRPARGPGRRPRPRPAPRRRRRGPAASSAWKAPIRPVPTSPILMALPVLRRGRAPSVAVAGPPVHPSCKPGGSAGRDPANLVVLPPRDLGSRRPDLSGRRRSRARRRPGRANPARGRAAP